MAMTKGEQRRFGKHPFLRQFGRETGINMGHQLVGGAGGALVGAGLGALGKAPGVGALAGAQLGSLVGAVSGFRSAARSSEGLRKKMGIGGKPITGLRQYVLPGSIRLAHRHSQKSR